MTSFIELTGPYIYNFGSHEILEMKPEIGSRIEGMRVIQSSPSLVRVCNSASKQNCKLCVESGWAKRKMCQSPIRS